MTAALVNYNAARKALALAHRVDEVKSIRDKAMAMQLYAKQAKDTELIDYATDIRLRAEQRAGELLSEMEKAKGTRGQLRGKRKATSKGKGKGKGSSGGNKARSPEETKTLAELGITKRESSDWQKLAQMPEEEFEAKVASAKLPKAKQRKFAVDYEAEREAARAALPEPLDFISKVGAEAAEAFARAILRALGADDAPIAESGAGATRDAGNATESAAASAELGADTAVAEDAPEAEDVPAPNKRKAQPGEPLQWDDFAEDKNDGGKRRGLAEPIPGKLHYLISPLYDDDGKAIGQQVERHDKRNGAEVIKMIASGDFTYAEAKTKAQTDFDGSIPTFLLRTPPVTP